MEITTNIDESPKRPILVVDFGSQYSMLIARRIRELEVYCEVISPTRTIEEIHAMKPLGVILSGGPASVYDNNAPTTNVELLKSTLPVLGICYGMQLMAYQLGGKVNPSKNQEYGKSYLKIEKNESMLFDGLPSQIDVWMSHADKVEILPSDFESIGLSMNSPYAAMANSNKKYGIQFHPEVIHTPMGKEILANFLFKICEADKNWTPAQFVETTVNQIKKQVGNQQVICGLSGGVDSAVAASLVHEAIGEQLTCIFVDNGLLRKGESESIIEDFSDHMKMSLVHVKAKDRFLAILSGVTDPEQKRKLIGNEFISVFEENAKQLGNSKFLVQGTTYPDVIESMVDDSGVGAVIKSHHNVGGLPENMNLELVEPIRDLFKDEVRKVGTTMGLPDSIVWRQPFPGPGLAIRIIGDITSDKLEILTEADYIVTNEIEKAGLTKETWQAFAVLTNSKSVGVMGDDRTYGYVIAVRVVHSEDAMTADWARLPYEVLETISSRIINEVPNVNRVVYDITSKPPGTIEWE
ncbi:MAG: glutamine-hydrolyzing GMP synthase [Dehalococcoidia bacterium]